MEWDISYNEYKACYKIHGDFSSSDDDSNYCKLELDEEYEDLKPPPIQIDPNKHKIIKLTDSNDDWLLNKPKPKVKTFADALKNKKNAPQISEEKKEKKAKNGKKEESDGKEILVIQAKRMPKHQKTKLERSFKRQRSNNTQIGEANTKEPSQKNAGCSKNKKDSTKDTSKQNVKHLQKQEDIPKKGLNKSQQRNRNRKLKKTQVTLLVSSDLVPYENTPLQTVECPKQNPSVKRNLLEQIFHEKWFEVGPEFKKDLKPPQIQIDPNKYEIIQLTDLSEEKKVKKSRKWKKKENDDKIPFVNSKDQKTKLERSLKRQRSSTTQNCEANPIKLSQKDANCGKNKKKCKNKSQNETTKENPSKETLTQNVKSKQKQEDNPKKGKWNRQNKNRRLKKKQAKMESFDNVQFENALLQTYPSIKRNFNEKCFRPVPQFLPFMMSAPPCLIQHLERRSLMATPQLVEVSTPSKAAVSSLPPPPPDQIQSLPMRIIEILTRQRRYLYHEIFHSFVLFILEELLGW